ncbi:MAG TPA: glycoside hydrolase family 97 protein [Phycisphaerae bacterium]|nr:glycoside hydrolase family 97 protein [Phycisphaerae bacterium]
MGLLRTLKTKRLTFGVMVAIGIAAQSVSAEPVVVESPGNVLKVSFELKDGAPTYSVSRKGESVIDSSKMGFVLKSGESLDGGFQIATSKVTSADETWTQPWGEQKNIRDHHNQLRIDLEGTGDSSKKLTITFRVFDDGVGFRYEIPEQGDAKQIEIMDELTQFAFPEDHRCWWIPAFESNRYEYRYTDSPLSKATVVHTPVTFKTKSGLYISLHEAALTDFSSMALRRTGGTTFEADLYPWADGVKSRGALPMKSPWRTIQVNESPGGLIENYLILNLNEPNKLGDVSWIKPGKYVGIWWEMHLGVSSWSSGEKHGATTENTKRYIDFAAKHGFDGVLVEGWNIGWDDDWMNGEGKFNFTKPYPDYDLEGLAAYAKEKGVSLIGHHETGCGVENYDKQLDEAFALCEKLGIRAVKSGYVGFGQGINRIGADGKTYKEWHHGQWMVQHYRRVVEASAKHHVMLDVHEPIKDTGIRRTYPNMMTREGANGQEYNAWGGEKANLPDHTTILPFTRMLAGPMDFTPGIFDVLFEKEQPNDRVRTTIAKQLALYVVLYSPLQMAADLPKNYEAKPEPFQFIKDVVTDWETTKVLNGEIGDYITTARKDRNSDDWFIGSITDENGRTIEADLSFLDKDRKYTAQIYRDGDDADWDKNPYSIVIEEKPVDSNTKLTLKLGPGGGAAIRLTPAAK